METYILILTLAFGFSYGSSGGNGGAGIATAEFSSKSACENAAYEWTIDSKVDNKSRFTTIRHFKRSAICVKK